MLRDRLRAHVETLAGEIGERHVFRPRALREAAGFVEQEWRAQGYEVRPQRYAVQGVTCANLEVTCRGRSRPEKIILVGDPEAPGARRIGSDLELFSLHAACATMPDGSRPRRPREYRLRMGAFTVDVRVTRPGRRPRWKTFRRVLVDSGSEMTWLPEAELLAAGVEVFKRDQLFVMAEAAGALPGPV